MATAGEGIEILVHAAGALANTTGVGPRLESILALIEEQYGVASAAVFAAHHAPGDLEPLAWVGLPDAALSALAAAVRVPDHPIARTALTREARFDVAPTAPGGPALRSHLPLVVRRGGEATVLGVLVLAHQEPLQPAARVLMACADLAAVAIELG